jgi:UPF0489 domain
MHIIPFRGRNHSGTYDLNLLWNSNKAYVMDNHLAASWCWLQKINISEQYNFLHIDRHYDLLNSQTDWWIEALTNQHINLQNISVPDLSALRYSPHSMPSESFPIFRWDNYLTIFNRLYPDLIGSTIFATHKDGDTIEELDINEQDSWTLQENLAYWLENGNTQKWIVNLDIDYFFTNYEEHYYQLYTDEFVIKIADELRQAQKHIEVITIALSPEMCGGWENAERVARIITEHLNIPLW